jgi:hypothetical protein
MEKKANLKRSEILQKISTINRLWPNKPSILPLLCQQWKIVQVHMSPDCLVHESNNHEYNILQAIVSELENELVTMLQNISIDFKTPE